MTQKLMKMAFMGVKHKAWTLKNDLPSASAPHPNMGEYLYPFFPLFPFQANMELATHMAKQKQ